MRARVPERFTPPGARARLPPQATNPPPGRSEARTRVGSAITGAGPSITGTADDHRQVGPLRERGRERTAGERRPEVHRGAGRAVGRDGYQVRRRQPAFVPLGPGAVAPPVGV